MTENKIYRRERYLSRLRPFYDADDLIKVITGIRRCGNKSCSLRSIGGESRDRDVPESNIAPPLNPVSRAVSSCTMSGSASKRGARITKRINGAGY